MMDERERGSVQSIMACAAREAGLSTDGNPHVSTSSTAASDRGSFLYRNWQYGMPFRQKPAYRFRELACYDDEEFIIHAYRAILGRVPDGEGLRHFLDGLRSMEFSKVDILGSLRFSAEGRRKRVAVHSLHVRYLFSRLLRKSGKLPFLGMLIRKSRWLLPGMRQAERHEGQIRVLQARLTENERQLNLALLALRTTMETAFKKDLDVAVDSFQMENARLDEKAVRLEHQISGLRYELTSLSKARLNQQKNDDLPALPVPSGTEGADAHVLDGFYVGFEDRFRGTREDIHSRLRVYLPVLEKELAQIREAPLLDLGCGRGEWLALLREAGFTASGVDLNQVMVDACNEQGLQVSCGDAIGHLMSIQEATLGAVTGFHIVEHLPFLALYRLCQESLRALRPSGMVIFETPNPENMLVGSCTFYYDPTHRNPLPPQLLQYMLENTGFVDVEILRLHPRKSFRATGNADIDEVIERVSCEQDYAVIGRRP